MICAAARRSGIADVVRHAVARRRVSILVYHDPSRERFESHLGYLAPRYSFVSLDQVADALETRAWKALPDYPLAVTFDDGWRGNAELTEVCRRFECPITVYACSQIVNTRRHYWSTRTRDMELKRMPNGDRLRFLVSHGMDPGQPVDGPRQALTHAEAQTMLEVADFGSHTRFHPALTTCSAEEARTEIALSKEEIPGFSGRRCAHFAYPYGAYGDRERELVANAGYRTARTVDPGWNDAGSDRFALRAFGVPDDASVDRLAAELAGVSFLWALKPATRRARATAAAPRAGRAGDRPESVVTVE
jgi:peptidoglycan/xylan/chitin deacetylase (PgdA/CDA1 family)